MGLHVERMGKKNTNKILVG